VFGLLEGKLVNLRAMEKEDVSFWHKWANNVDSEYFLPSQRSKAEMEKALSEPSPYEFKDFIIEKKDGTKIGLITHFHVLHPMGKTLEIGSALIPNERRKGYGTEAAQIMLDYLFLSKDLERIQAKADPENIASCKALEKAGFKREGILRKTFFCRGKWKDDCMFSILREEWKEPKILTKTK
jgi:RimJ/RimL family protein N-acetyltransferase